MENIKKISIVIPLYNEAESVNFLVESLNSVLSSIKYDFEVIMVDDGSKDDSFEKLREVHEQNKKFKVILMRRNFGQTAAMQAGIDNSSGDIIITLDADLENNPQNIPLLIDKIEEGFDIVSGWRSKRWGEGLNILKRKIPSVMANAMIAKVSGVHLHDTGCTLKAYRREIFDFVRLYGDNHRFIPAIASQYGAKVTEVEVDYQKRRFGKSKYGFSRTIRVFLDIILLQFLLLFFTKPMQFFGQWGITFSALGVLAGLYLTVHKLLGYSIGTRPLLQLSVLMIVLGVQLIMMGILGEVVMRTYFESQNKRTYAIREKLI